MRFGASVVAGGRKDPAEIIRELARALGAGGVIELNSVFGPSSSPGSFDYTDPYAIERVGTALADTGLELHSIHGPMSVGPASAQARFGPGGLKGALEAMESCIDACSALGGLYVLTQDGADLDPPGGPRLVAEAPLRRLADYAGEHGCVFCVENGAEDPDLLGRVAELVGGIDHSALGVCLDVGHAELWGLRDAVKTAGLFGGLVRTLHLHDNIGDADTHLAAGDGTVPWTAVLETLRRDCGYLGALVLETRGGIDTVRRSMDFLRPIAEPLWRPQGVFDGREIHLLSPARRAVAVDRFGRIVGSAGFDPGGVRVATNPGEDKELSLALEAVCIRSCAAEPEGI